MWAPHGVLDMQAAAISVFVTTTKATRSHGVCWNEESPSEHSHTSHSRAGAAPRSLVWKTMAPEGTSIVRRRHENNSAIELEEFPNGSSLPLKPSSRTEGQIWRMQWVVQDGARGKQSSAPNCLHRAQPAQPSLTSGAPLTDFTNALCCSVVSSSCWRNHN